MFTLQPGDVVRFYEITRLLDEGQGGMSAVYEARLRSHHEAPEIPERVALKVALPTYEDRLRSEADYMRRFNHPNVVKVYGIPRVANPIHVGRAKLKDSSEVAYMAMEFLTGGTLTEQLEDHQQLSLRESSMVARDIALALQHIHSRRVLNLDVKPDNILFRGKGHRALGFYPTAVLCDFGIARDLDYPYFGEHAATPIYAAPEHIMYGGADPRQLSCATDIFQWGIVVFLMVTGKHPFDFDVSLVVDPGRPAPALSALRRGVPNALEQMIQKALAKDPRQRYQTTDELLRDMKHLHLPPTRQMIFFGAVGAGLVASSLLAGRQLVPSLPYTPTPTTSTATGVAPTAVPSTPLTAPVVVPTRVIVTPGATSAATVPTPPTPTRRATSTPQAAAQASLDQPPIQAPTPR